jgi:hypothetical protein
MLGEAIRLGIKKLELLLTQVIALSYRRDDSMAVAGRLYDRLHSAFGRRNVFMDFDSIPAGVDFREHISRTIEQSRVVIVLIGPHWVGEKSGSRRIDDPSDFVRLEVSSALRLGIPVIPVLVNQTDMPTSEQLPFDLQELAFRNALPLDSGRDFHSHAERVVAAVRAINRSHRRTGSSRNRASKIAVGSVGVCAAATLFVLLMRLLTAKPGLTADIGADRKQDASPTSAAAESRGLLAIPEGANPPEIPAETPVESVTPQSTSRFESAPGSQKTTFSSDEYVGTWVSTQTRAMPGGGTLTVHDQMKVEHGGIEEIITTEWVAQNASMFRVDVKVRFTELQLSGDQLNARCVAADMTDLMDSEGIGKNVNLAEETTKAVKAGVGQKYVWTLSGTELRRGETVWTKE